MPMKFIDLFGGIGGFRYGIEQVTDWQCVYYADYDKYAVQTYNKNFGTNYTPTDITQVRPEDIPDHDIICGGFPCQAFSTAGARRGFEDTRGTLFFEIMRIAKAKRTKYLFLENVKGLLNHEKGETFRTIIQTMEELGYDTQWMVLNSKFHGVPQNRERVFIIGSLRGEPRPEILPFRPESIGFDVQREMETYPKTQLVGMLTTNGWDKRHEATRRVYSKNGISPTIPTGSGGGHHPKIAVSVRSYPRTGNDKERKQVPEFRKDNATNTLTSVQKDNMVYEPKMIDTVNQRYRKESPSLTQNKERGMVIEPRAMDMYNHRYRKESPCLTDPNHNSIRLQEKPGRIRKLTPIECERLQGFPDNWTEGVSDTQRYKQCGNAVTTKVISVIASQWFNNT